MWSGRRQKRPYFIRLDGKVGVGIPPRRTKVSIQSGVVASFASVCPGTQPAWHACVRISKDGGDLSRLTISGGWHPLTLSPSLSHMSASFVWSCLSLSTTAQILLLQQRVWVTTCTFASNTQVVCGKIQLLYCSTVSEYRALMENMRPKQFAMSRLLAFVVTDHHLTRVSWLWLLWTCILEPDTYSTIWTN